jgi:hypothetical protein
LADEGELGADRVGSIARRWPTVGSRAQRRRPRGELRGCGWRWPGRRSGVEGSSGRSREDKEEEKKIRKKEENRIDKEKKEGHYRHFNSLIHLTQPGEAFLPNVFLKRLRGSAPPKKPEPEPF